MSKVVIEQMVSPLAFDERPVEKRIGLVVLATDHTTEPDFQRMVAGERIGIYTARIAYTNPTTPDNLRRMQPRLSEGATLILPDEPLDAICYSCTSASVVMGDDAIEAAIREAKPEVPVITPPSAVRHALDSLGLRRISILTPYVLETSRPMADYFEDYGYDIARFSSLGLEDDRDMARIKPESLIAVARAAAVADAEALFISCTALRSAQIAAQIEREIGQPVITSNLATAWLTLRICGDEAPRPELGHLMTKPASSWAACTKPSG
ncbi:ectoine utilization protein EutA [Microvirga sp. KLBC 81]|uniref:ectoine utilization protein EutA n=1 Tax=Microvirga sp. KLBC 81 TaxID=1862707 RepID=UPI000D517139|nr:ectoine utilization protein EutA [Microvirga sp. KLBC 81]PVE20463.1 ectoine utilization protein EutA [Microvirga sp. KLBC 81]